MTGAQHPYPLVRLPASLESELLYLGEQYIRLLNAGICPMCRKPYTPDKHKSGAHHVYAHPCGHHLFSAWGHHKDPKGHAVISKFTVHRERGVTFARCL